MRYTANQIFRISPSMFDDIDDWIRAAQAVGRNAQFGVNALVMLMARTNQAYAMQMSAGILDPRMTNKAAAWKIPVRRITSRYYKGWQVRRLAPGVWLLENTSREAWFIEFGIHPHSVRSTDQGNLFDARVRRPIRKLSLIRMLKLMDQSRAGERVWEMIYAPFRPGRRYNGRGELLISDAVQSVQGMRFL